jgi:hypothetical protein
LVDKGQGALRQIPGIRVFPDVVAGREVRTYVAQGGGSQQGVDHRVQKDVSVGMSVFALVRGYLHSADIELPARNEAVYVPSFPYAEWALFWFFSVRRVCSGIC